MCILFRLFPTWLLSNCCQPTRLKRADGRSSVCAFPVIRSRTAGSAQAARRRAARKPPAHVCAAAGRGAAAPTRLNPLYLTGGYKSAEDRPPYRVQTRIKPGLSAFFCDRKFTNKFPVLRHTRVVKVRLSKSGPALLKMCDKHFLSRPPLREWCGGASGCG